MYGIPTILELLGNDKTEFQVREMEMVIMKTINWQLHAPSISEMAYILVTSYASPDAHFKLPLDFVYNTIRDFMTFGLLLDGCLTANYTELTMAVVAAVFDLSMADAHRTHFVRNMQAKFDLAWVDNCSYRIALIYIGKK
jgi:hypothetical protein